MTGESANWTPDILTRRKPFLPDWSYAGYRWGEEAFPKPVQVIDMAKRVNSGDDVTAALQDAIVEAGNLDGQTMVRFPPGTFEITNYIAIERSAVTIAGSGSGPDGTVFRMPKPLDELPYPPEIQELEASFAAAGRAGSLFAWMGGYFWSRSPEGRQLRPMARGVRGGRGRQRILMSERHAIKAGDTIQLRWFNRDGNDSALLRHIYRMKGIDFGKHLAASEEPLVVQDATVVAAKRNGIRIKERLAHDLRPDLGVEIAQRPMLSDIGLEDFRIVFPDVPYAGHLVERGYNAIYLQDVRHGWVRNVTAVNADNGFLTAFSSQVTLENITVEGRDGHHGISCSHGNGVLIKGFKVLNSMVHPITAGTQSHSCVYTDGWLAKPNLDQHRGVNHQNLFDSIHGDQTAANCVLFRHGGSAAWGPTAGAFNTFWNVDLLFADPAAHKVPLKVRGVKDAAEGRIIGLRANLPFAQLRYGPRCYVEGLNRAGIAVQSLYRYQLNQRLAANGAPVVPASATEVSPQGV